MADEPLMTLRRSAIYLAGGALLVAWLAAANMPGSEAPAPRPRAQAASPGPDAIALEVTAQASRLRDRMSQAPAPRADVRNPFAFGAPPRPHRAAAEAPAAVPVVTEVAPPIPAAPALTLMGIAEESTGQGIRRTAIIGGEADTLFLVVEGQSVGDRYKVTKIGADAVELEDVITKAYRRLALR
jgi:hypothetical protein